MSHKTVIDLCEDSPKDRRSELSDRREPERRHKRRRLDTPPLPHQVVEVSDGDEDVADLSLARRLQDAERTRFRADLDSDLRLARRLQAEEEARRSPPRFSSLLGHDGGGLGLGPPSVHGGRWDWLGSLAGRRPSDDWLGGLLASQDRDRPFGASGALGSRGFAHMPSAPHRRHGGGGQFGHLEFMDRDFNEGDYEMLLRLDEKSGAEKQKQVLANAKLLDQLPSRRYSKSEAKGEATCAICLESLRANQLVLPLPCKHEYHKACILKWLKSSDAPSCPVCKAPVTTPRGPFAAPDGSGRGGSPEDPDEEEEWWHT